MTKQNYKELIKNLQEKAENLSLEELENFSKAWKKSFISGFHTYSFYNYIIAGTQLRSMNKRMTVLASFRKWSDNGRKITKGEKAIKVFAPMLVDKKEKNPDTGKEEKKKILIGFRIVNVFDYSQTEGDKIEGMEQGGLKGDWTLGESKLSFDDVSSLFDIPVVKYEMGRGEMGYTNGKEIHVLNTGKKNEMISTYIHELAHSMMHFDKKRAEYTAEQKETEAETVSYLVCKMIGLENTASAYYIKGWKSEKVNTMKVINTAEKITKKILTAMRDK